MSALLGPLLAALSGGAGKTVGDLVDDQAASALISASASVREAAKVMAATRRAVVATDEDGALVGILTPKDVAYRVIAQGLDMDTTLVCDVATPDPDVISADKALLEALHMLHDGNYLHLPVVSNDTIAGVVDVMDVVYSTMGGSDSEGWSTLMATNVGDDEGQSEEDRMSTTSFDARTLDESKFEANYVYKVVDKVTGNLHRVQAPDDNFQAFREAVSARLGVETHLTYLDDEGDEIVRVLLLYIF